MTRQLQNAHNYKPVDRKFWIVKKSNIPSHWKKSGGKGVKVAVLDSGIALNHPDLKSKFRDKDRLEDFTDSKVGVYDVNGHGTHITGIIACPNKGIGIAPQCELYVGKVINDKGYGNEETIAEGIEWAVDNGVDIICISLSAKKDNPELKSAIKLAYGKKVVVVCAAGNLGPLHGTVMYPAKYETTISVGAVDSDFGVMYSSSRGSEIDVFASGEHILSTAPFNGYSKKSGTSMAAAFVTGVVALMKSKNGKFSEDTSLKNPEQVKKYLREISN